MRCEGALVLRESRSSRAECVEVVWTRAENEGLVGEGNSKIQCERFEVERKAKNGIDGQCEKSIE